MIRSDPEKPEWTRGRMMHAEDCRRVETLWYTFTIRPPSPRFKNFQIKADGLLAWWLEQWNMGRLWGVPKSLCASLVAFLFDICTPYITHTYKINPAKRSWTHVEDLFKRPFGIIRRPHTTVQSCNPQAASSGFKPLQAASFVFRFSKPGRAMSYDRSGPGRNPVVQTGRSEKIESESVPKWTCECGAWAAGPIKDD